MIKEITSKDNNKLKHAASLKESKYRKEFNEFLSLISYEGPCNQGNTYTLLYRTYLSGYALCRELIHER